MVQRREDGSLETLQGTQDPEAFFPTVGVPEWGQTGQRSLWAVATAGPEADVRVWQRVVGLWKIRQGYDPRFRLYLGLEEPCGGKAEVPPSIVGACLQLVRAWVAAT